MQFFIQDSDLENTVIKFSERDARMYARGSHTIVKLLIHCLVSTPYTQINLKYTYSPKHSKLRITQIQM